MKARLGMCAGLQTSTATASPPTEGKRILPFWKDLLILEGLFDWRWRETIWWQALVPGHGNMQRLGPRGSGAYTAPWQDLTTLPHDTAHRKEQASLLTWLSGGYYQASCLASTHTWSACLASDTGMLPACPMACRASTLSSAGKLRSGKAKVTRLDRVSKQAGGELASFEVRQNSHVKRQVPVETRR